MCSYNLLQTANTGMANVSTANSNLNGTGSMNTVLTAGDDGTFISGITIKAMGNSSLGMVRIFIYNGVSSFLYREIMIPCNSQTGVVQAFSAKLSDSFFLQSGYELRASTQNAESFSITVVGENVKNCEC
jgi:hypothetical protein